MILLRDNNSKTFNNSQIFVLSVVVSAVLLFVCSKNSIFYEMNDNIDVNVFLSVTDAIFQGKVLYTDIFEHKGPFQYLVIYSLVHILGNSYFTIYLIECLANALFIFWGTKTILLYDENANKSRIFLYALILEFCLCTAASFMFGGVPEELFLWMSSYGLYTTLRCLKRNEYYSHRQIALMGLFCGTIFWTKFSILGLYSGIALFIIIWNVLQKTPARLAKTIALFLSGFLITCIPIALYFSINHNFNDLINVYFLGNILDSQSSVNPIGRFYSIMNLIYKDITPTLLILFGTIFIFKSKQNYIRLLYAITLITTFITTCCLKVYFTYYPMPMMAFVPLGIVALRELKIKSYQMIALLFVAILLHLFVSLEFWVYELSIGNKINHLWVKEHLRVLAKAVFPLVLLYISFNTNSIIQTSKKQTLVHVLSLILCTLIGYGVRDPYYFTEQEMPQIQFKEKIQQIDNANILIYGSYDYGFYRVAQTYPQVKYFCNLNIEDANTKTEQERYIKDEVIDFIITSQNIEEEIQNTSYKLIDTAPTYYYNGYSKVVKLYKKQITSIQPYLIHLAEQTSQQNIVVLALITPN